MNILLTGGTGFIGSHTAVELIMAGYDVVIADDLSNSSSDVVDRIKDITGIAPKFYAINVCNSSELEQIFKENRVDAVIHFAGFKSVGESVKKPIEYYRNDLDTTLTLLEVMRKNGTKKIIFSSSATVYGLKNESPLTEDLPTGGCTNPYGWTKYMIEQLLTDAAIADKEMSVMILRYFNPIGAHESGLIGEKPCGIPNNLILYITQVAAGILERLSVFGNDYHTPDGTGVRDYIHVVDLAKGHLAALKFAETHSGTEVVNLGTSIGYSVLDIVNAFENANQIPIPHVIAQRRAGDIATCYADPSKAANLLGWDAEKTITDMCRDSWRWQQHCRDVE